jgi:two-component system, LytTR family, sensor kinase
MIQQPFSASFINFIEEEYSMIPIIQNRLLQHIAFWIFCVLIFTVNYASNKNYKQEIVVTLAFVPGHMLFVYTQLYFLVPRFLQRRKVITYILLTLVLTLVVAFSSRTIWNNFVTWYKDVPPEPFINIDLLRSFFAIWMLGGIAVSIKLLKDFYKEKEQTWKAMNEKIKMELELLKSQVHPHFLFNTLNNLYSLTLANSKKAPIAVAHLSDLLRYMLYECKDDEVPLETEITIIKKYAELEKLRYGDRIEIAFSCTGEHNGLMIAPLLLLPFVENSFKYGTSEQLDHSWINLNIHLQENNLEFHLSNSRSANPERKNSGGLGLSNVKKRLDLIYGGKHELFINDNDPELFVVKLKLKLKKIPVPNEKANNIIEPALSL